MFRNGLKLNLKVVLFDLIKELFSFKDDEIEEWHDNSFICEYCGTFIMDSQNYFTSGCRHYPLPEEIFVYPVIFSHRFMEAEVRYLDDDIMIEL
jgi:hypothetical protein